MCRERGSIFIYKVMISKISFGICTLRRTFERVRRDSVKIQYMVLGMARGLTAFVGQSRTPCPSRKGIVCQEKRKFCVK